MGRPVRARTDRRDPPRAAVWVTLSVAAVMLAGLLWDVVPGHAHSYLKSSDPSEGSTVREVPDRVVLTFDEPVDIAFATINVLGPDGDRVDTGPVGRHPDRGRDTVEIALREGLENGRYTVAWRVVAQDGHPRSDRFRFRLQAPTPPSPQAEASPAEEEMPAAPGSMEEAPDIAMGGMAEGGTGRAPEVLLGVTRGLLFVALLMLAGFLAFVLGVWRRPGETVPNAPIEVEERFAIRWRKLVRIAWIVAVLASIASLYFQASISAAVSLGEVSLTHVREVMASRVGLMALIRVGLLLVGAVVWMVAARAPAAPPVLRPGARRQVGVGADAAVALPVRGTLAWFSVAFVLALLFTVSFAGHAGTTPPVVLGMTADILHLAGAAAWLGALTALVVVAFPATRGQEESERTRILAPVIARFSNMAVVAITVVVAGGLVRSLMEVQGFDGLTGTSYGLVLLAKVGVFVPIIGLGAFNNRRTKPACMRAAAAGTSTPALGTLRRLITVEVVLGILVVGMAAWLVNLTPPRSAGESGEHALRSPPVHAPARPSPQ